MAQSDIIRYPDGRKGRLINAQCHIERSCQTITSVHAEEQMLQKIWPDWPERICEFINLRIGPCNDPSKLYQIPIGRIVETALMWAGVKSIDRETLTKVCEFISAHLGINPEKGNARHTINPREICKGTLLWILAECGKNATGFTRDKFGYEARHELN